MKQKTSMTDKLTKVVTLTGTAVLINLMFLVFSLPIVTIGQAWCGLMTAIRYNIRGDGWFKGFWTGFKRRFWRGTVAWLIGLPAVLYLLNDIQNALSQEALVPAVGGCIMLAFVAVMLCSALTLNVYIPTSVSNWIRNTVNLGFKALLKLVLAAALFWAPVLIFCFVSGWLIYELAMVFLFAYFALVGLVTTMLLKGNLIDILVDARVDGTLTAEEGLQPVEDGDE